MRRALVAAWIAMVGGLSAAPTPGLIAQDTPTRLVTRDSIVARLADLRRIHTPEGIEALEEIEVGGTKQWISIRGLNAANPVLLVLHGGPGSPLMGSSWAFQKPWEDYFTVVQWDQRGVGKNFLTTDTAAVGRTLSTERMARDAEEVVAYVRRRLNKEKVVLMGFSFGTVIGTRVAKRRPEWLHAYVGVGQSAAGGERYVYDGTLAIATARNDTAALRELRAIAPYPGPGARLEKALLVRKYARMYDGGWYGKRDFDLYFSLPDWGPEYTDAESRAHLAAMRWAEQHVVSTRDPDAPADRGDRFGVPVLLLMGRYDLHTLYEAARAFFGRIEAPTKKFVTFERSSHFPMFEEPGRFLVTLVGEVLPLTGEGASFRRLP